MHDHKQQIEDENNRITTNIPKPALAKTISDQSNMVSIIGAHNLLDSFTPPPRAHNLLDSIMSSPNMRPL